MSPELSLFAGIVVAILGGAAVGVERQRSGHATGPDARLGGIRTFTLLGTLAGIAGWLTGQDYTLAAAVLIAGGLSLTVMTVLLLAEKPRLHRLVERLDDATLLAAARYARRAKARHS